MKIYLAADHAGYDLKDAIKENLNSKKQECTDYGTDTGESVDYPDYVHALASDFRDDGSILGIICCGSGNGVCMTANKYPHIRAALAWRAEIASLARAHNNANVLCLPARFISQEEAISIVDVFLSTAFEGGRHQRRADKIAIKTN